LRLAISEGGIALDVAHESELSFDLKPSHTPDDSCILREFDFFKIASKLLLELPTVSVKAKRLSLMIQVKLSFNLNAYS